MTNKMMFVVDFVVKLAYLSGFSMIGVLIRYNLGVLSETFLKNTNDFNSPLFVDLLANMVGSFFMGWVGIVWMEDISNIISEDFTKGISTGLIGSITTFSSWNQRMVELASAGQWRSSLIGYLIGIGLSQVCLEVGIQSGKVLKGVLMGTNSSFGISAWGEIEEGDGNMKPSLPLHGHGDACTHMLIRVVGIIVGIGGWVGAMGMSLRDEDITRRTLWLACVTAPPGVLSRWYLSFLNHDNRITQWLPIGTLSANLMATILQATFSATLFLVKDRNVRLLIRIEELGLLGCMSSMSTFVAEIHSISVEASFKKALAYALLTLLSAFLLGFSIYSVPAWVSATTKTLS